MIVKVQRPIASAYDRGPWLIYDRSREHDMMLADSKVPPRLRAMMGEDFKIFVHAELAGENGAFVFHDKAPAQDW